MDGYAPGQGRVESAGTVRSGSSPICVVTAFWIAGILLGRVAPWGGPWLCAASLATVVAVLMVARRRSGAALRWLLIAVAATGSAWFATDRFHVPHDHVGQYLSRESTLVRVIGTVEGPVQVRSAQRGAFSHLSYEPPSTVFTLRLSTIVLDDRDQPCNGTLLVKISESDYELRSGNRIVATGWLSRIRGPLNPGERDYQRVYREAGIDGRLTLANRGNRRLLDASGAASIVARWRDRASEAASQLLGAGLEDNRARVGLLQRLLLGRTSVDAAEISQLFRRVGLAHLLAISGAHLAILLGLTWFGMRLITGRPRLAAGVVLIALAMFLIVVPWRVPIVRAGIMAGLFAAGYASGRRAAALDLLAMAALILLVWRPADLFTGGFQLSFGVVTALILFTRRVGQWIWPDPLAPGPRMGWMRWAVDYLAVSLIAFAVAMPIAAYHFQYITPLAVLLSILALPVVTATLGLGYAKILVGLWLPNVGLLLAGPLAWVADMMISLVSHATTWPGATIELQRAPSVLWAITMLAVCAALFTGIFYRRKRALAAVAVLCTAWLIVDAAPGSLVVRWLRRGDDPPLRLNMLAIGDGSCYVLRIGASNAGNDGAVVMFDCGSRQYWHLANHTVLPALRHWGVERIDALFISHAHLDHFNGTLDLIDRIPVSRVRMPPHMLAQARLDPTSTTAYLIEQLDKRRIPIETVTAGWRQTLGAVTLEALWPPPTLTGALPNDTSIVLRLSTAGRRVLLCGDIQQHAMMRLIESDTDLRADACNLPHHGSYVDSSPRFIDAVNPTVVVQSSGPARLRHDRWEDYLSRTTIIRHVSARDGMVELAIDTAGDMTHSTFRAKHHGSDGSSRSPALR